MCKIEDGKQGEVTRFYGKNNFVGVFEINRDKVENIDSKDFNYTITQALKSKNNQSKFHELPAEKKTYGTEKCDENI